MSADFIVTVNGARGDIWERVAGTRRLPIKSPLPCLANVPGHERAEVYLLDLEAIEPEVVEKILAYLCGKFQLSAQEGAVELKKFGIPVLAQDCMVTVLNPQRWIDFGSGLEADWPEEDWDDDEEEEYYWEDD